MCNPGDLETDRFGPPNRRPVSRRLPRTPLVPGASPIGRSRSHRSLRSARSARSIGAVGRVEEVRAPELKMRCGKARLSSEPDRHSKRDPPGVVLDLIGEGLGRAGDPVKDQCELT